VSENVSYRLTPSLVLLAIPPLPLPLPNPGQMLEYAVVATNINIYTANIPY
jgi:hypothetical protein